MHVQIIKVYNLPPLRGSSWQVCLSVGEGFVLLTAYFFRVQYYEPETGTADFVMILVCACAV